MATDMRATADRRERRLLNEFQRGFPLTHAPYAEIAKRLDVDEDWVCGRLARWQDDGRVSRVGAVFRPRAIGASTLAALAVPEDDLERIAAIVSAHPAVNHNYEREHRYNLWFVVVADDAATLSRALADIARDTGLGPISLPLVADYWIDLGFDLDGARAARLPQPRAQAERGGGTPPAALSESDRRLIAALARGLPLVSAPYEAIAAAAGVTESEVLARIARWLDAGVIARLGVVVRHRELGYTANAMCVWDVPDEDVDAIGAALSRESAVSLCYRRQRALPDWPYNLYCMVHGRDRASVEAAVAEIAAWHGIDNVPSAVLFSHRRFKQRGARYFDADRGQ